MPGGLDYSDRPETADLRFRMLEKFTAKFVTRCRQKLKMVNHPNGDRIVLATLLYPVIYRVTDSSFTNNTTNTSTC